MNVQEKFAFNDNRFGGEAPASLKYVGLLFVGMMLYARCWMLDAGYSMLDQGYSETWLFISNIDSLMAKFVM